MSGPRDSTFPPKIREKAWDPREELRIFQNWIDKEIFEFNLEEGKPLFVMDTPPPYPSGRPWHTGAAAGYARIDMVARTARMFGKNVLFPIGIDRNGLPVEIYTEKLYKINLHKTPRQKFIELCKTALDDLEEEMISILKSMGYSADFKNHRYRTDSEEYRLLTQTTFINLWNKNLIYESTRPNNYCPVCGTTIADAEVEYEDIPSTLTYIKFPVRGSQTKYIQIATTRPELICACDLVIVNPEDKRYQNLLVEKGVGDEISVVLPIYNREVRLQKDPSVDPNFGSGAAMVCSYGDYNDVLMFRKFRLKERVCIDEQGRMTQTAGKYAGLKVKEAREAIIRDLRELGFVEKEEKIIHRTPTCERSENPIEIIPMNEYYLKQIDFKDEIINAAYKELRFFPESNRQILVSWVNSISLDWPISRRRYYGTEIPIWYCGKCNEPYVPPPGREYYKPWKDKPPIETCKKCGHSHFVGDERTFDTWMDSSVTALYISHYLEQGEFFRKTYPTHMRLQGKDIVRTWLYYSILRCRQLTGKNPFSNVWIDGMGLDEKGEKMSKSKGNVLDPIPILQKYGGDTFRLWSASEASQGYDFRISEVKIAGTGKFLTKLWNIARFISSFPNPQNGIVKPNQTDRWILAQLSAVVSDCLNGYNEFNFFVPANKLRDFTWNIFADHYMEMSKWRAYGERDCTKDEQQAAQSTLHYCLKTLLLLFAPIIPFITDKIWLEIYGKESIHLQEFPKPEWHDANLVGATEKIVSFNSEVWKVKRSRGLSLKDGIDLNIPHELSAYARDLIAMHNLIRK